MDFITPKEQIQKEILEISEYLNILIETNSEDLKLQADEIVERGNTVSVYMARTGDLLADAKYHLNEIKKTDVLKSLITQMGFTFLSASAQKDFISSACVYESWLVDKCERVNKTCTHQIDWYRSVLSKYKEELNASKGFRQQ